MSKIRRSVLYAASLSVILLGTTSLSVLAQDTDTQRANMKNLVNIKQNHTKSIDNNLQPQNSQEQPGEVLVANKFYTAKVSKNYSEIESLITQNRLEEAKSLCEEKLKANPANNKVRVYLGNVYSAQYKLGAALAEYKKVIQKEPNNAEAHNGMGLVYYRKTSSSDMEVRRNVDKYYQEALKEFETAIRYSPDFYRAYNNAGKIMQEMGKLDEAENYYRKALDIEPKYSEAIENLGSVLYSKNQREEAIQRFKEAIDLNSKNSSAYYRLGEALIAQGEYSRAINYLQTALYLNPNSAPVHDMLGKAYQLQGNEAAAIIEYKKSSLIKPEYSYPYLRLANIYQDRGDYELAISELKSAISINPDFLEGKLKIADISLKNGKTDQAIKYYREVMGNQNYTKFALKGLANAYFMKAQEANSAASMISESEYVEAEQAIKQAIQFNPDDMQLYLALLRVSRLTNKDNQSELYLSKIVDRPANQPLDHVVKGEAFITYKKYNDAQTEFKRALNMVSKIDNMLYLGEIFITNRQYPAAKEAFNKVLSIEPENLKAMRALERIQRNEDAASSKFNIAKGFYNEGQRIAAIETFKDALSLNPYLVDAQLMLAKAFEKEKYYFNAIEHYTAYVNLANMDGTDVSKYAKKIESLSRKVEKMEQKGKTVKKFTRL